MNERIKQLAEQAWTLVSDEERNNGELYEADRQRERRDQVFAELIVQECGNWFNNRLVVEPDYGIEHRIERNRAVVGVMKEFNQHFGVEDRAVPILSADEQALFAGIASSKLFTIAGAKKQFGVEE